MVVPLPEPLSQHLFFGEYKIIIKHHASLSMKSLNLTNQASLTTGKDFGGFSLASCLKG